MESELSDYRKKHSFCLKESEGKVKIGVLLERTINRLSWAQTSEVLVDVLLILGAIPTNVVLKRCLHASFDDEASEAAFHRMFPKILFSLDYIPFVDEVRSDVCGCCRVSLLILIFLSSLSLLSRNHILRLL